MFDVKNLRFPELDELLSSDPEKIEHIFSQFSDRVFNARHVGVTSQELQSWENQGFLPYAYPDAGWRKFSFIETVWLKCIQRLRSMDVSHKKILFLKDFFFTLKKSEMIRIMELMPMLKGIGMKKYLFMAELELNDAVYKEVRTFLDESQHSRFSFLVLWILLTRANACLVIDENDQCLFTVLGPEGAGGIFEGEADFNEIQYKSFVLLNLRSIVLDFFGDEKLQLSNDYILGFLSRGQQEVLEKIKEPGIKSITIRFKDGEPAYFESKKGVITPEILSKVSRYLNRKDFKNIEFKVRNGELISYEETDISKL